MKKVRSVYQSKDFDFPKSVYLGCININDKNNKKRFLCLTRVFEDMELLKQYVLFVIDDLSKSSSGITPSYTGKFIKCDFARFFPLKKTHWSGRSSIDMDIFQKFRNDVNIVKYWKMSELLVTPDGEIDGVEFFSFCISLFKNTPSEDIDLYIKNTNHVVDIRAKNGALYAINKPVSINWLGRSSKNKLINPPDNYIN